MLIRKTAPELIADRLRLEIMCGELPAGVQLKQGEIAARFGASIVPVREAFQRLVNDGLAVAQANKGVTVTEISENDFIDIAELRVLLEPQALGKSATSLTAGDYEQALAALKKASATQDLLERAALHWEFHRVLYARCNRPRLIAQIANLHLSINRYVLPMWSRHGLSDHWDQSHVDIVDALRAGDVAHAQRIVVDQIEAARDRVLHALRLAKTPGR